MRVIQYPRVSSKKQAEEGDSIESQENKLTKHSKENSDTIVGTYTDAGKSASLSDDNIEITYSNGIIHAYIDVSKRPGMMKALEEVNQDRWDGLKITKWDRFSRNNIFSKLVQMFFRKNKKEIIPIDDSLDPLLMDIKGALSEEEIRKLKGRIRETRLLRFEKGDMVAKAPVGYLFDKQTKKMIIDKKKAESVKKLFEMTANGSDYKEVCSALKLKPQQYYNMLRNKSYMGILSFEGMERAGNFEPIVSKELWEKANHV